MPKWDVNYDGWLTVEADTELKALELVNKMLSDSGIVNDGEAGEWYLLNAEIEEPTNAV